MLQDGKIEELALSLKGYIATNFELVKLEGAERASVIGSGLICAIALGIVGLFCILFVSLGASFYLSGLLADSYSGFGIVAAFYLLIALLLVITRKKLVAIIRDKIVGNVLNS